jgi:hypothetical protein
LCAATGKWVCRDGANGVLDWEGRLDMEADGLLRTIVAGRRMDQLIGRTPGESGTAREEVQALLEKELRVVARELGATLGNIVPGSAFATRGRALVTFTAGSQLGEATVTARTGSGSHSVTITVV